MRKIILITGVNGFIGGSFWRYLKRDRPDYEVYGIDVKVDEKHEGIFICNLNSQKKLKSILIAVRPDYIFHFAGGRIADEKILLEANTYTTKKLFDSIVHLDNFHPRVLIPGSAAEYGRPPSKMKLIDEGYPPKPMAWYGLVKLMQSNLALMYGEYGVNVVIARMFNILGAGTPPTLAIGRFAEQIVRIERGLDSRVIHTRNLDGLRDFLDIDDVCRALLLVAEKGSPREIYNVCSGQPISIRTMLEKLLNLSKVGRITVDEDVSSSSSSFDIIGSCVKLQSIGEWYPKVSIEESLEKTIESYRKMENRDNH